MEKERIIKQIEEKSAPYGYYLLRKDKKNSLLLGFAEIAGFAASLFLWVLSNYFKTILSEKAKFDFKKLVQDDVGEINKKIELLSTEIKKLKAEMDEPEIQTLENTPISLEVLKEKLELEGLSKRASTKLAEELHPLIIEIPNSI